MDYRKYVVPAAVVAGVAGVLYALRNIPAAAHQAGQDALRPVTDGAWSLWEKIRPYTLIGITNPVENVEFTRAGFYLNSKYVSASFKLSEQFIQSMILAHKGNEKLINQLTDPYRQIKPEYRHLINNEVSEGALNVKA